MGVIARPRLSTGDACGAGECVRSLYHHHRRHHHHHRCRHHGFKAVLARPMWNGPAPTCGRGLSRAWRLTLHDLSQAASASAGVLVEQNPGKHVGCDGLPVVEFVHFAQSESTVHLSRKHVSALVMVGSNWFFRRSMNCGVTVVVVVVVEVVIVMDDVEVSVEVPVDVNVDVTEVVTVVVPVVVSVARQLSHSTGQFSNTACAASFRAGKLAMSGLATTQSMAGLPLQKIGSTLLPQPQYLRFSSESSEQSLVPVLVVAPSHLYFSSMHSPLSHSQISALEVAARARQVALLAVAATCHAQASHAADQSLGLARAASCPAASPARGGRKAGTAAA